MAMNGYLLGFFIVTKGETQTSLSKKLLTSNSGDKLSSTFRSRNPNNALDTHSYLSSVYLTLFFILALFFHFRWARKDDPSFYKSQMKCHLECPSHLFGDILIDQYVGHVSCHMEWLSQQKEFYFQKNSTTFLLFQVLSKPRVVPSLLRLKIYTNKRGIY